MKIGELAKAWRNARPGLACSVGPTSVVLGPIWLVVVPGAVWIVRGFYVPILGVSLSGTEMWLATAAICCGAFASLVVHAAAHVAVGRLLGSPVPERLPLYPAGDASQVWPAACGPGTEAIVAASGPAANVVIAAVASLGWAVQAGTFSNTVTLFLLLMNLGIAALNLAPAFPLDGGRIIRAVAWGGLGDRAAGTSLAYRLGWLVVVAMAGWAAFLAWQQLRFSGETTTITLGAMALLATELASEGAYRASPAVASRASRMRRLAGTGAVCLTAVALATAPVMLLPTNLGMDAPGPTASVEPMVHVPRGRAHYGRGSFILTTIIPQAPIVVGEWLYARHDPAIRITAAKNIVASNTTPQQMARQGLSDLQQSEQTAIIVGLNLAGFHASLTESGAMIVAIEPQSKATGILMPGDAITSVDGVAVHQPGDISQILGARPRNTTAMIGIRRGGKNLTFDVHLTPVGTGPPKIGIAVAPATQRARLPFRVSITPRKVEGGPSAGLMFALSVFDVLTPTDLTRGYRIAGTGTIDLNGHVGPIGGVAQKVAAAEQAGAQYFLVPIGNYAEARAAAGKMKVVKVSTIGGAVRFLETLKPAG